MEPNQDSRIGHPSLDRSRALNVESKNRSSSCGCAVNVCLCNWPYTCLDNTDLKDAPYDFVSLGQKRLKHTWLLCLDNNREKLLNLIAVIPKVLFDERLVSIVFAFFFFIHFSLTLFLLVEFMHHVLQVLLLEVNPVVVPLAQHLLLAKNLSLWYHLL